MKTRAAILTELHKPLTLADIELPSLGQGQVLVKVKATGVCGSQLGEIIGIKGPDKWLPHLLGHEAGGVVEEVGEGVTKVEPGDHVVLHWRVGDGMQADTPKYSWNGDVVNAGWVTTFQEKSIVSENRITRVPKDISFEDAALYGCVITTGFGIVENDAKLKSGETVLVIGCGGVGLVSILASKIQGAKKIIAVDIFDQKLASAKEFGATDVINSKKDDLKESVQSILGDDVIDVVLENTGMKQCIEDGYELSGPKGRVILVGVPKHNEKANIDTLPLHFGKVITGSHGGNTRPSKDIPRLLELVKKQNLNLISFCSRYDSLEKINQAIEDQKKGQTIRAMIVMEDQ